MKQIQGQILLPALVLGTVSVIVLGGLVSWGALNLRMAQRVVDRERAIMIAEAGNEYYRWHLAQDPEDYQDGTGEPGPYVHDVEDKDGNVIGSFSLDITPPMLGGSVVTIRSTGTLAFKEGIQRTVETILAIPSLARYAVISNSNIWLGEGSEVFGEVHSNGGIRFDGFAHNMVRSARDRYNDPSHSGGVEFGVHTHVSNSDYPAGDPLPSSNPNVFVSSDDAPDRPDVFAVGREFPVPLIDFGGFTADLAQIATEAASSDHYYPSTGNSGQGYHIVLKPDNTYDLYRVTQLATLHQLCPTGQVPTAQHGTWSIVQEEIIEEDIPLPQNGVIFVEDHVWVDGRIDGARITIAAAEFHASSSRHRNIIVNNDLLYTNYDGTDAIGLFAQQDIIIGLQSEDELRIDAALIAQNGSVQRPFYYTPQLDQSGCGEYLLRNSIITFGMIGSNERYSFWWDCNGTPCSGYENRHLIYDANLLFSPPPFFPRTTDQYETIAWEEIRE